MHRGTSRRYALNRLERDAPELYQQVVQKKMTAHAAMVQAGFRPPTFTVRADSAEQVAETLKRRLPPEMVAELAAKLA